LRDLFALQPFVFLQHGVTNNDMSQWLWKYNQNIAGFVTSWERECQHILAGDYGYRTSQVWLTGFPRFDRLYSASKRAFKQITIMPTWRQWLMEGFDSKKSLWTLRSDFEQSEWVQFWTAFLNHPRLHQLAQAYNCKIAFLMHPSLASANARLTAPNVTFLPPETSYREVYAQSDCVITDYSSAVFDFAYLQKPILYAPFDRDRIWSGEHSTMKSDFFDYERDGFGEVALSVDELLDALQRVLVNDCQLAPVYQQRVQAFFPYRDCANCERVYKQIVSILKSDNTNVSL
jgi:CDP-glycerol glycerophosphotransferase (TagB/SpsB family)